MEIILGGLILFLFFVCFYSLQKKNVDDLNKNVDDMEEYLRKYGSKRSLKRFKVSDFMEINEKKHLN